MKKNSGYIILEAILAIVVFAMVVLSIVPMVSFLLRRTSQSKFESRASALLQESMEASYNIFISNWDAYQIDGTYHPGKSVSNRWVLFANQQTNLETLFTRAIDIKKACRNLQGDLLEESAGGGCSGVRDPDSRYVTTTVTWEEDGKPKSLEAKILLVNLNE